jgi:lysyl-tRNA synthetase class I
MSSLLLEALDKCGIEYKYYSAKDAYDKGLLLNEIRTILTNAKKVGEIIKEEVGQETYSEVLPFFAVCEKCGHLYTTRAYKFDPKNRQSHLQMRGAGNPRQTHPWLRHEGEVDIKRDKANLPGKANLPRDGVHSTYVFKHTAKTSRTLFE